MLQQRELLKQGQNNTKKYLVIPSLDGIRAVSILIVFISHAGLSLVPGGFGVTVFFFLSGYLITTLLRKEFEDNRAVNFKKFYMRRIWRILPPMYGALALAAVFVALGLTSGNLTINGMLFQGLHLSNYYQIFADPVEIPQGAGVMWSLAIEEHFYLLFPFVGVFLMKKFTNRTQANILLSICSAILAWRIILVTGFDATSNRTYLGTDTRSDAILFGCVLGLYFNPALDAILNFSDRAAMRIAAISGAVILFTFVFRDEIFRETIRYTIQSLALFPIFYFAISKPHLFVFKILNIGWVKFLGVLSYSLYLVHHIVILAIDHKAPELNLPLKILLSGIISLAIALVFFYLIEQPSKKMKSKHAIKYATKQAVVEVA